jgi:thioesterase domain-containing protein
MAFRGLTVERLARALEGGPEPTGFSPLVPIQTMGSKPPLFLVHPAAGVAFPYFELARRLGPDQPLYGLQALGLDGESPPDERIEDMARHYIEALQRVQPRGPYFIGGHSFGCLVAFEMAQQLSAAGEELGLLAIIDEPAPLPGYRPTSLDMVRFLSTGVARSIWPHLHDYFYLMNASRKRRGGLPAADAWAPPRMLETFLARAAMANFVPPDSRFLALRQPAMLPMFQLFLIHVRETFAYQPKAYPHRVTLFFSDEVRNARGRRELTMGWDKLAAGGVEVHEIPGDHLSLLRAPHVQTLARKLEDCIDRAQGAARTVPFKRVAR